ncbi:hypothetical protein ACFPJ1_24925 [Kribbella qitaiheensis]|uniref:hypothetical protein n=1 Tax=Kribbella qitaiheensis TaxID=1544730 RepID=UPI003614E47F
MTDRPDVPDSAVILTLSRVEFGIDSVLDSLRTPDPFGIRGILTEYSAQEQPNLAEKGLILAIDGLLRMRVPGHTEWPTLATGRALRLVGGAARRVRRAGRGRPRLKLPAVGVVGGFFDERKGIPRAAYAAADLLGSGSFRIKPV